MTRMQRRMPNFHLFSSSSYISWMHCMLDILLFFLRATYFRHYKLLVNCVFVSTQYSIHRPLAASYRILLLPISLSQQLPICVTQARRKAYSFSAPNMSVDLYLEQGCCGYCCSEYFYSDYKAVDTAAFRVPLAQGRWEQYLMNENMVKVYHICK